MIGRSKVFPVHLLKRTLPLLIEKLKRVALNVRILRFVEHSRVELSLSPTFALNKGLSMLLHSREMK